MPKVARKRVRTSFSILTVQESMRSHNFSDWWWSCVSRLARSSTGSSCKFSGSLSMVFIQLHDFAAGDGDRLSIHGGRRGQA
ncbi:hypothetical protein D3C81_2118560 [compost metagenome]